jgi:LPXTG-motif cell wall-anchored protein
MVRKMLVLAAAIALMVTSGSASAQGYGQGNFLTVSDTTPLQGQTITVTGCCYSGTVAIDLLSTPQRLGTATAGADGVFSTQVTIPADTVPGPHAIVATGPALDGSGTLRQSVEITVLAAGADDDGDKPGGVGKGKGKAAGALPRTGADSLPLVQIGVALVLLGAGAVLSVRNRRGAKQNDEVSVTT